MSPLRRTNSVYFVFGFALASCLFLIQSTFFGPSASYQDHLRQVVRAVPNRANVDEVINERPEHSGNELHENEHDHDHAQNQGMFKHTHGDSEVARTLRENVRVFCWIMSAKKNSLTKAVHINATWAPRCNKYVFFSAEPDSGLPTVDLNVTEGRNFLWAKTKAAFQWIYENEINNYDWFLKADDDTYVIMENMRFMLLAYSPEDPVYFGCRFRPFTKQGYMSGGSGYVLSREAVKRFVVDAIPDPKKCKVQGTGAEDAEIGKCLANVDVLAGDSRDSKGRHRMLPFSPMSHLQTGGNKTMPEWFYKYMYYPYDQGGECCSDYMISFHYVNKGTLYALDNLLYHIRPIGSRDELWFDQADENRNEGKPLLTSLKELATRTSNPLKTGE